MLRKSALFAALAVTLAAGSAFADTRVIGKVTRVDAVGGNIWLNNGQEFGVGTVVADGLLPGDKVSIVYTDYDGNVDVLSTSPNS